MRPDLVAIDLYDGLERIRNNLRRAGPLGGATVDVMTDLLEKWEGQIETYKRDARHHRSARKGAVCSEEEPFY